MTLNEIIRGIEPINCHAAKQAKDRWDSIAKPLGSLGLLEDAVIKMAGMKQKDIYSIKKKCIVVMCADNGVVEEGVTQTGSEVTAVVAKNFTLGNTSVNIMADLAGSDVLPVDIGMLTDVEGVHKMKVAYGTNNMAKGPAMTELEAIQCILAGIEKVRMLKEEGYEIIGTGEMGIGNTTTSSAVASVLLDEPIINVTGKGAGLSDEGLNIKIQTIHKAIERNQPDKSNPIDVIAKVGGFDIAGLAGIYLGGAFYQIPIVIDGFIAATAALAAVKLCSHVADYILPSHMSKEPAAELLLNALCVTPPIRCGMYVGEGTGAAALFPLLDMAVAVYEKMSTFHDIKIEEYKLL